MLPTDVIAYLDLILTYREVNTNLSDSEEDVLFDRMESLFSSLSEEECRLVNSMAHDLNLLDNFQGVTQWKSLNPSTLKEAVVCFTKGEYLESLDKARNILGSEDRELRQGLILACYERILQSQDRFQRVAALAGDLKYQRYAREAFLTYAGDSC